MSLRFFRRIRIAPGISLNLSKRGGSLSVGPRGAKVTVGRRGIRQTVGLPGTGLWYTEQQGYGKKQTAATSSRQSAASSPPPVESALELGFFQKLFTPPTEKAFIEGLKEIQRDRTAQAYAHLIQAPEIADAVFTAAMMAMRMEKPETAEPLLKKALSQHASLGHTFNKYGLTIVFGFAITERIHVSVTASRRGALLALAEVHQALGRWQESVDELRALLKTEPSDHFVRLSLCEMLVSEGGDTAACKAVVKLCQSINNESEVEAALLLWKGTALNKLGIHKAALDTLTIAFRRKKDRSQALLNAIGYDRALTYEALGNTSRYRSELESLYAEAPDYEDIAQRLGL
jgi:tetratricopeptide (TPR) repeat protein